MGCLNLLCTARLSRKPSGTAFVDYFSKFLNAREGKILEWTDVLYHVYTKLSVLPSRVDTL